MLNQSENVPETLAPPYPLCLHQPTQNNFSTPHNLHPLVNTQPIRPATNLRRLPGTRHRAIRLHHLRAIHIQRRPTEALSHILQPKPRKPIVQTIIPTTRDSHRGSRESARAPQSPHAVHLGPAALVLVRRDGVVRVGGHGGGRGGRAVEGEAVGPAADGEGVAGAGHGAVGGEGGEGALREGIAAVAGGGGY